MKQKVKLIASDLDGTLLQNYMPDCSEEAIELITALTKKGVIFVPASGRQYFNQPDRSRQPGHCGSRL